ncbi:protein-glutamate O-methyltransferase CheR [Vibrio sp. YMD68]|uniref:CheR family methyltransferase n=1 Tax=Vibrio sp. YMD68 TaxID=3042300 RepID=UPI00249C2D80|nr:protein-glutamate O-methyltransferase CheR [Vibrio sp. YMD68]WGW01583.1 protein-glutamate O-methyltransferase CheR [Vibrio sp. YMD68]
MAKTLSDRHFNHIQNLVESYTGIYLADNKRGIVENRLQSRLNASQCQNFEQYLASLDDRSEKGEFWTFIDKMTTHETSFFREEYQFFALRELLETSHLTQPINVWSAACSTGEEAYTLAMVLEDTLGEGAWSVLGTDISDLAISQAKLCHYDLPAAEKIPSRYRRAYCLKGIGAYSDHFTVVPALKKHCHFQSHNLLKPVGEALYEVIFLRNILIYFSSEKQRLIVRNSINALKQNGLLFLGHSENILRDNPNVELVDNCIYRKVANE